MLFSAAFAGFAATAGVQAQSISFEDNAGWQSGLREAHRTTATWADLNNDGKMDFYYGGTSGTNGWAGRGQFAFNNGNGFDLVWSDDTPRSAYGMGSLAFDYDQDGNIDLLIQSRGGNDTGTPKRFLLIKNNGDRTFTESDAISSILNENFWYWKNDGSGDQWSSSEDTHFNGENELGAIAVADYDKDGYPDVLIMGKTTRNPDEDRITKSYVTLLHNEKGKGFKAVEAGLEQMSEGAVAFADFDNDGWFDILLAGGSYANGKFRIYKNNQDGTFTEVESVKDKCIVSQGSVHVLDYNQDGKMDVILNGFVDNFGRHAVVFLNNGEDGNISFDGGTDLTTTSTEGVRGTNEGYKNCDEVRDFNGDGWVDFITNGWSDNHGGWGWSYSSSKGAYNSYDQTTSAGGSYWNGDNGCTTFGDIDGDGLADVASFNWWNDGEGVRFAKNTTAATIVAPAAPENVVARFDAEKKAVVMTWDGVALPGSNGKAMYNVYIKNKATGETHVMVAADIESGFQKAYLPFASYLLGNTYSFVNLENGTYEVGVQSVAYSYVASAFATTEIEVVDPVAYDLAPTALIPAEGAVENLDEFVVLTCDGDIYLNYEATETVRVYNQTTGEECEFAGLDDSNVDMNQLVVLFDPSIATPGSTVVIEIPAGLFGDKDWKDGKGGNLNKALKYTYTVVEPAAEFAVAKATWTDGNNTVDLLTEGIETLTKSSTISFDLNSECGYATVTIVKKSDNSVVKGPSAIYPSSITTADGKSSFVYTIRGAALTVAEGNTYTVTVKAWKDQNDANGDGYDKPTVGSYSFDLISAGHAYVYSDVVLMQHISEPFALMSKEQNVYTLEFSGAARVKKAVINTGNGSSVDCQVAVVENTDNMKWEVTIPSSVMSNTEILLNVFAEDMEGHAIKKALDYESTSDGGDNTWLPIVFEAEFNKPDFTVSPASESVLEKIDVVTFSYSGAINVSYATGEKIKVMTDNGRTILAEIGMDELTRPEGYEGTDELCFVLDEPITAAGNYIIEVPANFFNLGEEFAGFSSKLTTIYYEIAEPKASLNIVANPAGGNVTEIPATIVLTADCDEAGCEYFDNPKLTDERGNSYNVELVLGAGWNEINVNLMNGAITAAGTYTLTIPAGLITDGGSKANEEIVLVYTIATGDGIDAIVAQAGGKVDVYTVSGVCVLRNADAAAVKALRKGLYIINGKKVVLK